MRDIVLKSKLAVPVRRKPFISRQRLHERLNQGLSQKLVVLSAPAGFGKTTLLSDWIQRNEFSAAWLNLDESDNDPSRFHVYLAGALARLVPELDLAEARNIGYPSGETASFSLLATANLINEIEMARLPDFVLVLDDYHHISEAAIHNAVEFLLDHQPPNLHLVIASRADPPLPLARWRARGELLEIRQKELRFTQGESLAFLIEVMGLCISPEDVTELNRRTEGWIAGLQMAAISMQGRDDPDEFVCSFSGTHRFILDYLVEEVLQRQTAPVQDFLVQTSILDRFNGSLCNNLTGREDSQALLEELDRQNLFIIPLDDDRQWYRYHRLFADLLQKRLLQEQPDQVAMIHQRASQWFEQNGYSLMAIDHALASGDLTRSAYLIDRVADDYARRGEFFQLNRWLEVLPEELLYDHPNLGVYRAWWMIKDNPEEAPVEEFLDKLLAARHEAGLEGKISLVRAYNALFHGDVRTALHYTSRAMEELPPDEAFFRGLSAWIHGVARMTSGDFTGARRTVAGLDFSGSQAGNILVSSGSLYLQAEVYKRQGKLRLAKAFYDQALQVSSDVQRNGVHGEAQFVRSPAASKILIGLGAIYREWNDLQTAVDLMLEGIDLSSYVSELAGLEGYIGLARIRLSQGDFTGTKRAFEKARQIAARSLGTTFDDQVVDIFEVDYHLALGDLESAWNWVVKRGLDQPVDPTELDQEDDYALYHLRKYEYIAAARVLLARNQPHAALSLLEWLIPRLEKQERYWPLIPVLVLKAKILFQFGDLDQALLALTLPLEFAETEGSVRVFLDEGEVMMSLLQIANEKNLSPQIVQKLIAVFENELYGSVSGETKTASSRGQQTLLEPLSDREVEVLRLLQTGMTAEEIAASLYIATSTVRTHIKHIYAKLEVNRRMDAIRRAAELGML